MTSLISSKRPALFLAASLGLLALSGCGLQVEGGGEANLALPQALRDGSVAIWPLYVGLGLCLLGLLFGLGTYSKLKGLPVHQSMKEISELIYTTCKAYLIKQGKFLLALWVFIAAVIVVYFALTGVSAWQIVVIIAFSLVGMTGSFGVAWFGIRINTFANSRTAFAALGGQKWSGHQIPARAGMSIGMVLISLELLLMLLIVCFLPIDLAGKCFIGFAIGESLGASALRIAGGIFTKIADVGADLMKIVFKIEEDDPRNPGTIADCTGDNAGDSVGPSADGFETYGVTGVALITFITLGVAQVGGVPASLQAILLV
ncbi:MAG: sodium/proton-translocating pyrophosphatase, partial [Propionibacteriaceae bacterium]|nr:sodium/proton-translocating pyrophosphatase [Propionibacteriaceae bacterium]